MNLCLLCRETGPGTRGGLPRAMFDLALALHEEGHTVALLTDSPDVEAGALPGVSVRTLTAGTPPRAWGGAEPETAPHSLMHAAAAYREVRRIHEHDWPVDAVLAPLWRSEGAVCLLDREFPTVVSCMTSLRTLSEIDPEYGHLEDLEGRLALERASLRRSEYLHGLTEAVLLKTIEDYGLEPRIRSVIGRGIRDRGWLPLPSRHPGRIPHVLFVGRIAHRKGVDILLAAARILIEEGTEACFTLVGAPVDGPLQAAFAKEAETCPRLSQAVRFAGPVGDEELDRLYGEADVVCVPTRYESHGVVLIEAMMHGRPILTCPSGGIAEVVEPGVNGWFAPPEDPVALAEGLRLALASPERRAELGAGARRSYEERFQSHQVARRMASFMERVAGEHDAAPMNGGGMRDMLAGLLLEAAASTREEARCVAGELLAGGPGGRPADTGPAGRPVPVALGPRACRTLAILRESALANLPAMRPRERPGEVRVSAVVLTRDRSDYLPRALDSLEAQEMAIEVIVIDNDSGPETARAVRAECEARTGVRLHRSERNLGVTGGRNLGVELAEGELVLFLDDDAELLPGALAHMVNVFDADPEAAAVTTTVVTPDGLISHSGGTLECTAEVAGFALIASGRPFAGAELAPTGRADWVGGGAALMRRALLEEFPLDEGMSAYYEDNEWCYRVSLTRPGAFRRSREALALHHLAGSSADGRRELDRARLVALLAACARFYELHGLLIGPWSWDLLPEQRAFDDGVGLDLVRLLMELITAKGPEWVLAAWTAGRLDGMLLANRRREALERHRGELDEFVPEVSRLNQLVFDQQQTMSWLFEREATLRRIEAGGWWRLRARLSQLIPGAGAPGANRRRTRRHEP